MSPKFKMLFGALALTAITASSFAAPVSKPNDGPSKVVSASFHNEFHSARLLTWEITNDFTKLTFNLNGQIMFAFYAPNGELLALSRNILSSQLPLSLGRELKTHYGDYWISDLFEINNENGNYYYVTLENGDRKIVLRSVDTGSWETWSIGKKS